MTLIKQSWQRTPSDIASNANLSPSKPKQETAGHGCRPDQQPAEQGTDDQGTLTLEKGRTGGRHAPIEELPPELLLYLSHFLDLAGLIVLSTATGRTLRTVFRQFDREFLFLEPPHRLNLAEWRDAARQVESYALTRQDSTSARTSRNATIEAETCSPTKVQINLDAAMFDLTRDESLIDLDLFKSVLDYLSRDKARQPRDGYSGQVVVDSNVRQSATINQIRSLYLTGWHGMAGTFLIQQLRSQPSLRDVCTIVKTERADARIWQHAAVEDQALRTQTRSTDRDWIALLRSPKSHPSLRPGPIEFPPNPYQDPDPFLVAFERFESTQIIVQVGKRRPRREGQAYLRGEGLQMGYQGYCTDVATTGPGPDTVDDAADAPSQAAKVRLDLGGCSGAQSEVELGAIGGTLLHGDTDAMGTTGIEAGHTQKTIRRRLHVILQGREEMGTKAEDRMENEEMFERSIVTCNHCKERIKF